MRTLNRKYLAGLNLIGNAALIGLLGLTFLVAAKPF